MSTTQQFKAGEARGRGVENANQMMESVKDKAQTARDKTCDAARSTHDSTQQGTEKATGFLQQTGEQVMNMAQGAVDSVKNTLGVGDNNINNNNQCKK